MDQKARFHSALDRRLVNTPADVENWLLPLARLKASCLQRATTACPGLSFPLRYETGPLSRPLTA